MIVIPETVLIYSIHHLLNSISRQLHRMKKQARILLLN